MSDKHLSLTNANMGFMYPLARVPGVLVRLQTVFFASKCGGRVVGARNRSARTSMIALCT